MATPNRVLVENRFRWFNPLNLARSAAFGRSARHAFDVRHKMEIGKTLREVWGPHHEAIRRALEQVASAPLPVGAEFLWFVLLPAELVGVPIMIWPAERDQEQHNGWEHERVLLDAIPSTVTLPDEFTCSPEGVDRLRDEVARFLSEQWRGIEPPADRLAYFSIEDDGTYFDLRDGRMISAWNLENEIGEQVGVGDP